MKKIFFSLLFLISSVTQPMQPDQPMQPEGSTGGLVMLGASLSMALNVFPVNIRGNLAILGALTAVNATAYYAWGDTDLFPSFGSWFTPIATGYSATALALMALKNKFPRLKYFLEYQIHD